MRQNMNRCCLLNTYMFILIQYRQKFGVDWLNFKNKYFFINKSFNAYSVCDYAFSMLIAFDIKRIITIEV